MSRGLLVRVGFERTNFWLRHRYHMVVACLGHLIFDKCCSVLILIATSTVSTGVEELQSLSDRPTVMDEY